MSSTHPVLTAFPSLYPVEPSLSPLLRTLISIPDVTAVLCARGASPGCLSGPSAPAAWMRLRALQCFRETSVSYTVLSRTPCSPEGGLEGRKTWNHRDERKPYLAPFAIIVIVSVAIAGTDKCTLLDSFSVPVPYPGWSNNKPGFPLK